MICKGRTLLVAVLMVLSLSSVSVSATDFVIGIDHHLVVEGYVYHQRRVGGVVVGWERGGGDEYEDDEDDGG